MRLQASALAVSFDGLFRRGGISARITLNILGPLLTPGFTHSRASTATVFDNQGYYHTARSGELRIEGARRVENEVGTGVNATASEGLAAGTVGGSSSVNVNGELVFGISSGTALRVYGRVAEVGSFIASIYVPPASAFSVPTTTLSIKLNGLGTGSHTITPATLNGGAGGWLEIDTDDGINITVGGTTPEIRVGTDANPGICTETWKFQIEKKLPGQVGRSEYVSNGLNLTDGVELFANGSLDSATGWSLFGAADGGFSSGVYASSAQSSKGFFQIPALLQQGQRYVMSWDQSGTGIGSRPMVMLGVNYTSATAIGAYQYDTGRKTVVFDAPATGPAGLLVFGGGMEIDNVSLQHVVHHGAGVDGVKNFNTDRDGNPITTPIGMLVEQAATNLLLNNATLATQSVTVVNTTEYTLSFFGTGTVTLSGAATNVLVGSETDRSTVTFTTTTTSLTLTVSGSVLNANLETGNVATTPIPTEGSAVTRSADVVQWAHGIADFDTKGTAVVHFISRMETPIAANADLLYAGSVSLVYLLSTDGIAKTTDGTNTASGVADLNDGELHMLSASWGSAGLILAADGTDYSELFDGTMPGTPGVLTIGKNSNVLITELEVR